MQCDQERPSCSQCTRSRRQCAGYQRDRHFKNLSALDHDTLVVRKQPLKPITEPSFIQYHIGEVNPDQKLENVKFNSIPSDLEKSEIGTITLPQLFEHFLSEYLPKEGSKQDSPAFWIKTIQNTSSLRADASLPFAMTALSLVRLGKKYQNVELEHEGMAAYGQALGRVQATISSNDFVLDDQTLASCMTLLVLEVGLTWSKRFVLTSYTSFSGRLVWMCKGG